MGRLTVVAGQKPECERRILPFTLYAQPGPTCGALRLVMGSSDVPVGFRLFVRSASADSEKRLSFSWASAIAGYA